MDDTEASVPETVLVIPCYNEAHRLPRETFRRFAYARTDVALLFVDDGSRDDTLDQLQRLAEQQDRVSVLALPKNAGKAEAVRQGCLAAFAAQPRYIGYWDADLATPLAAVDDFRAVLNRRPKVEIIFGARVKLLGTSIQRSAVRHYLGRVFATAASLALGLGVYDTQCGAKLFRASEVMSLVLRQPFLTRWLFDIEILARLIREARAARLSSIEELVSELPLTQWREVPGSKVKASDFPRAFLELIRIYRAYLTPKSLDPRRHNSSADPKSLAQAA
jgi:dolichyl-phosphate beta-glucosyltransferase